jgi:hypothetical protein
MIKFKVPKIDSLRLLVPLDQVQILDSKFLKTFVLYCPETDEVDDLSTHIKTQVYHEHNGIKMKFAVKSFMNTENVPIKYLIVGISTKMLKENYFEGINRNTIEAVFNYVNSLDIIKVTKESFLNAKAMDVDFCIDFKLTNTTCKEVFSVCYDLTIPSKTMNTNLFKEKTNRGIEWGDRDKVGRAYKTKQFTKYYAKVLELKYNSTDFYNAYIKEKLNENTLFADGTIYATDNNEENILRIETTIKNPNHFKTYDINCVTLLDLLKLDLSIHSAIFNRPIQTYMNGYRIVRHNTDLSPLERKELFALNLLATSMKLKPIEVIDFFVNNIYPSTEGTNPNSLKVQRSRFRTTLQELIEIDKKTMIENKDKNTQLSMEEMQGFGLIPIS